MGLCCGHHSIILTAVSLTLTIGHANTYALCNLCNRAKSRGLHKLHKPTIALCRGAGSLWNVGPWVGLSCDHHSIGLTAISLVPTCSTRILALCAVCAITPSDRVDSRRSYKSYKHAFPVHPSLGDHESAVRMLPWSPYSSPTQIPTPHHQPAIVRARTRVCTICTIASICALRCRVCQSLLANQCSGRSRLCGTLAKPLCTRLPNPSYTISLCTLERPYENATQMPEGQ